MKPSANEPSSPAASVVMLPLLRVALISSSPPTSRPARSKNATVRGAGGGRFAAGGGGSLAGPGGAVAVDGAGAPDCAGAGSGGAGCAAVLPASAATSMAGNHRPIRRDELRFSRYMDAPSTPPSAARARNPPCDRHDRHAGDATPGDRYLGCGTMRRYGRTVFQPPGKAVLASASDTEGTMMTSSPCFQSDGVATLCLAVSCSESITRSSSSKLRPVLAG